MRFPVRFLPLCALAALGAVVACSGSGSSEVGSVSESSNKANVVIQMSAGPNLAASGTCSGTLIAPTLVLTSGHCVSAKTAWTVTEPSSGQTAKGVSGHTYDWMEWKTTKSHPLRSDLGVIKLDKPIKISAYPTIAN